MKIYRKRDEERILESSYGYFSSEGWEYVIESPLTPRPWVNVISNGKYGILISQGGGGFSWMEDTNLSRITRWFPEPLEDRWGKFIYLRDNDKKKFFSITYQPLREKFPFYQVRHSTGYTVISGKKLNLRWSIYYFVPLHDQLEVWYLLLENEVPSPRSLSLFTYLEWCLGNGVDTHWEYQRTFIETKWEEKRKVLFARKRELAQEYPEIPLSCFHTSFPPPHSYEGSKENFIGKGNISSPYALLKGRLTSTTGKWSFPIGSLEVRIKIPPRGRKEIVFLLGMEEEEAKIHKYRNFSLVKKEWMEVKAFWKELLSRTWVETPDISFNIMNNIWLKYQTISGRIWGRTGFYQSSGAYGFRDQLQDSLVFLPLEPSLTRKQISLHASHQFSDGSTYHWWHEKINQGPRKKVGDDYLWLPFLVGEYFQETGDVEWIRKEVSHFADKGEGSILEHCILSLERALKYRSKRKLPLIGEGDWNDGINKSEKGESVWLGEFLLYNLENFSEVLEYLGYNTQKFRSEANILRRLIRAEHWDGNWFRRAYLENGKALGSHVCKEGKIFLNPQSWAIIAKIATEEQINSMLKTVRKYLYTPYGPLLLSPPYTQVNKEIGYLTRYAPGVRENSGVYTHAACWWVQSLALVGRNSEAWELYSSLLPPLRGLSPDSYQTEPYVTAGNSDGISSSTPGRGGWTWYTGSSQWLFKVGLEWILGVRAMRGKLVFTPHWPREWKEAMIIRFHKGKKKVLHLKPGKRRTTFD